MSEGIHMTYSGSKLHLRLVREFFASVREATTKECGFPDEYTEQDRADVVKSYQAWSAREGALCGIRPEAVDIFIASMITRAILDCSVFEDGKEAE